MPLHRLHYGKYAKKKCKKYAQICQKKNANNMQTIYRICISLCIGIFCIYMHFPLCWCRRRGGQFTAIVSRLSASAMAWSRSLNQWLSNFKSWSGIPSPSGWISLNCLWKLTYCKLCPKYLGLVWYPPSHTTEGPGYLYAPCLSQGKFRIQTRRYHIEPILSQNFVWKRGISVYSTRNTLATGFIRLRLSG